jgi:hypothetical protein
MTRQETNMTLVNAVRCVKCSNCSLFLSKAVPYLSNPTILSEFTNSKIKAVVGGTRYNWTTPEKG